MTYSILVSKSYTVGQTEATFLWRGSEQHPHLRKHLVFLLHLCLPFSLAMSCIYKHFLRGNLHKQSQVKKKAPSEVNLSGYIILLNKISAGSHICHNSSQLFTCRYYNNFGYKLRLQTQDTAGDKIRIVRFNSSSRQKNRLNQMNSKST